MRTPCHLACLARGFSRWEIKSHLDLVEQIQLTLRFLEIASANVRNMDIQTNFPYLAREVLYQKQKPFATDFIPKVPGFPLTNHVFEFMELVVQDAQPFRDRFSLERNGFCFLSSSTMLKSSDANDAGVVEGLYYAEIEAALHKKFPEYSRLDCLDHQVCKIQSQVDQPKEA